METKIKQILSFVLAAVIITLFTQTVNAYSGGGGTCNCGDGIITLGGSATDACVDCSVALNDNAHCANQVNYVGTVTITNYNGTCINNSANFNNKIFDCKGHTIDGDGISSDWDIGIYLIDKHNNTIRNCIITDFCYGIYLSSFSNNTLTNNIANNN